MMARNWVCPFCAQSQTLTSPKISQRQVNFEISDSELGDFGLIAEALGCSNPNCRKVEVNVVIAHENSSNRGLNLSKTIFSQRLIPSSEAKPQPEFIPFPLREDYLEACLIRNLSPKASATLARRCLQGMLRDFCGVSGKTLYAEVEALRSLVAEGKAPQGVSIESVDAIHHVREVGNIGAHMEKDIDHIVPVEPDEAQLLIELIESLFDEWYIARETRARRFGGVKSLAESKKTLSSGLKSLELGAPKPIAP